MFILMLAGSAIGQLSGIVVDGKTKMAVLGASVRLNKEGDSLHYKTMASDKDGRFSFKDLDNGKYVISVSYIGFQEYTALIGIKNNKPQYTIDTISMKIEEKNLIGVKVTNKTPPLEFNGNRIILNVNESPVLSTGSAYEAITKVPGVIDMNSSFKFRGKSTLVLIDNKQTYLSGDDLKQMLSSMPANNIQKIEVLAIPSANYDAAAQSIINIKTIKNKSYGLNGLFTLGGGAGVKPRYNGGINLNYRTSKLNIYGNYNFEHVNTFLDVDLDRTLGAGQYISENSHEIRIRNNNLYKLGVDFFLSKNTILGISFNGYTNQRGRTDYNNVRNFHNNNFNDSMTKIQWSGTGKFINGSSNLYFKQVLDTSGQSITINGDYVHNSKNPYDNYSTNYYLSDGQTFLPTYNLRDTSITVSNVYSVTVDYTKPIKNGHIDAGMKSTFTENDNNLLWQTLNAGKWIMDTLLTQNNKYNENIYAAYISAGKTIGRYEITGGLRYEGTNIRIDEFKGNNVSHKDFGSFFPNLSIDYKQNENNQFSISYRKSVDRPTFRDLSPWLNYYSQYSYYTGNPNLRPQYNHDFNLSYSYKNIISVGLQFTHTNDVILPYVTKSVDNIILYGMANVSFFNIVGLSVNYSKQVNKIWWFNFSNTLQYQKYSQDVTGVLNNTGVTYSGDIKNTFTFKKGWSGEIYGNYNSASPFGIYRLNNGFLSGMGAGFQKTIIGGRGKLAFSATDLFNTSTQRYSTDSDGISFKKNDKVETRFFRMVFTYKFGNKNVKSRSERKNNVDDIKNRL